jgi:hypothetical protein
MMLDINVIKNDIEGQAHVVDIDRYVVCSGGTIVIGMR